MAATRERTQPRTQPATEREQSPGGLKGLLQRRLENATKGALKGPNQRLQDTQKYLLDFIADHPLYAMWRLIAFRGLRRGEACGVRWIDHNGKTQALEDDINEASVQVLNLVVTNRQKVNLSGVPAAA